LIQPLVENSLIHGLETKQSGGYINIAIKAQDKTLRIDVSDNGTGIEPEYMGKNSAMPLFQVRTWLTAG